MPTYEYRCAEGHAFERFQRMSDDPLKTCPECGAVAERLLSAGAGFLFKGSGFYITDYRSESWREGAKRDGAHPASGVSPGAPPSGDGGSGEGRAGSGSAAGSGAATAASGGGGGTAGSGEASGPSGNGSGGGSGSGSGATGSSASD